MVEWGGLENRCSLWATVGSNPTLSALKETSSVCQDTRGFFHVTIQQTVKLLDDNGIYLGSQLRKTGSDRTYGVAADGRYLLVCEFGEAGAGAEIVVLKRWN